MPVLRCGILVVLLYCSSFFSGVLASSWGSRSDARGDYLVPGPENNSREYISNGRCAKVHNSHGPNGWNPRWRPVNIAQSQDYWSTPVGPRSTFASSPHETSQDLWTFLGGDVQLFTSFTSLNGERKAVFASTRCILFTRALVPVDVAGHRRPPTVGVEVVPHPVTGEAAVVATPNRISGYLDFLGKGWFPIVLGMTPSVPGTVPVRNEWQERDFENAPDHWRSIKFHAEASIGSDARMWSRRARPEYDFVDGSDVTIDDWVQILPPSYYSETQCRSLLNYEDRHQSSTARTAPLVAVSGIIHGNEMCDTEQDTWGALYQITTERRESPNALHSPLSVAEGVLLVALPAVWEVLSSVALFALRVSRGKIRNDVARVRSSGWIWVEGCSVLVTVGEFVLLILSTVQQLRWQPCWLGRWSGSRSLTPNGTALSFQGNESEVLGVQADVVAIECREDPGTDAKWAVAIGVVLVFHVILLFVEWLYLSTLWDRIPLHECFSGCISLEEQPDDPAGATAFFAGDDNYVVPERKRRLRWHGPR